MPTGRSLTVCQLGVSFPGGCLLPGWCLLPGVSFPGVPSSGASPYWGVSPSQGVWYPSMHWDRPPLNRITDAFKSITLAQLLCGRLKKKWQSNNPWNRNIQSRIDRIYGLLIHLKLSLKGGQTKQNITVWSRIDGGRAVWMRDANFRKQIYSPHRSRI